MKDRTNSDYAKIIARGRDAYQDYTLIQDKVMLFKEGVLKSFEQTKTTQDIERRNLWQALQIADMVLESLLSDITDGKHAIQQLEEIKRAGKPSLIERVMP